MKVKIEMNVTYNPNTVHRPEEVTRDLEENLQRCIGDGLLTGSDWKLEVDTHDVKVTYSL